MADKSLNTLKSAYPTAEGSIRSNERPAPKASPVRALPWLLVLAVVAGALLWTATPLVELVRYSVYWGLGLVLPGTLVFRAVRGSRGNLPEDLAFGAVTGLVLELPFWALAVSSGVPGWLWMWPAPVVAAFLALPRLRRHWRMADPRPLPLAWSWAMAGVIILMTLALAQLSWAVNPLPPATHSLFGDTYYYWANAAELTRTAFPQRPQTAGTSLRTHWLSDAHRAAAHLVSGVPLSTVMLRVWDAPLLVVTPIAIAGLARQASRVWWSGPLAAAIAGALPAIVIWPRFASYPVPVIAWHSPSLTYSIPVLVLATALVVDVARGRALARRGWVLLSALAVVAGGAKPSSLPVLCAGILAAGGAAWVVRRRPPVSLLAALSCAAGAISLTAPTMAGGLPGAGLQLGAWFTFLPEYVQVVGEHVWAGSAGLLPPSLSYAPPATRFFLPLFVFCWVLSQAGRLVGLGLLFHPDARRDPAVWLLAGMVSSGLGAALLVNHVAASEGYFWFSAVPAGAVLTSWLLVTLAPARPARLVGTGLGAGALAAAVLCLVGPGRTGEWETAWLALLGAPVLAAAALLWAATVWWRWARRQLPSMHGRGLAVIVAGVIGLGLFPVGRQVAAGVRQVATGVRPSQGTTYGFWVEASEMRAARWLATHAGTDDVVATNVHCETIETRPWCSARSFWVAALTERRVVLEGWAYDEESLARHGNDGFPYFAQLAPDQERLRVNDLVFAAPTPAALDELCRRYGARWLFADSRAATVSPHLAGLADVRYVDGPVTIYELRRWLPPR